MDILIKKFFDAMIPMRDNLSWEDVESVLKEEESYFPPTYNDDLKAHQRVEKAKADARHREYEKNKKITWSGQVYGRTD